MANSTYKDLKVWSKSIDLAVAIYKAVKQLPKEELYGLSDQMRRAVVSIPSNIAEGNQRDTTREYVHFLHIAKGSVAELDTQILLCDRLEYIKKEDVDDLYNQCSEIGRMLNGLINKLLEKENERRIQTKKA